MEVSRAEILFYTTVEYYCFLILSHLFPAEEVSGSSLVHLHGLAITGIGKHHITHLFPFAVGNASGEQPFLCSRTQAVRIYRKCLAGRNRVQNSLQERDSS